MALPVPTEIEKTEARIKAKNRFLGYAFLRVSDKKRYGKFLEDLDNYYTKVDSKYPESIGTVYNLINNFKNYQNKETYIKI